MKLFKSMRSYNESASINRIEPMVRRALEDTAIAYDFSYTSKIYSDRVEFDIAGLDTAGTPLDLEVIVEPIESRGVKKTVSSLNDVWFTITNKRTNRLDHHEVSLDIFKRDLRSSFKFLGSPSSARSYANQVSSSESRIRGNRKAFIGYRNRNESTDLSEFELAKLDYTQELADDFIHGMQRKHGFKLTEVKMGQDTKVYDIEGIGPSGFSRISVTLAEYETDRYGDLRWDIHDMDRNVDVGEAVSQDRFDRYLGITFGKSGRKFSLSDWDVMSPDRGGLLRGSGRNESSDRVTTWKS